jgi:hypothetical protein
MVDGKAQVIVETAVVAFNSNGYPLGQNSLRFLLEVNEAKLRRTPHAPLELRQEIDLHKGEAYLAVGMRDMTSGAGGVLELPVQVPAAARMTP